MESCRPRVRHGTHCRRLRLGRRHGGFTRRSDRHRYLAAAHGRLLRARQGVERGYEAWAKIVNDKGGIAGRKVQLKILDDQSNADRVVSDYESLIGRDRVDLVFGPFSTRLVVRPPASRRSTARRFVERAGAAVEAFEQGLRQPLHAAPAIVNYDDHLADHLAALPEGERTADGRGSPRRLRACSPRARRRLQGQAGGRRRRDPRRTRSPANIYGLLHRSWRRSAVQRRHRDRWHAKYQDAVNLIIALQPELSAGARGLLHRADQPEFAAAIGGATEGNPCSTGYSPKS